jgi:hypothetical protein
MDVCEEGSRNERLLKKVVSVDWFDNARGHVGIKINDQVGQNFQTKKGL